MIGVLCHTDEQNTVSEFFELFKTPWEFFDPQNEYDVVISTLTENILIKSWLTLIYTSKPGENDPLLNISSAPCPAHLCRDTAGTAFPIYGDMSVLNGAGTGLLRAGDGAGNIAIEAGDTSHKVIRVGYDLFSEVAVLLRGNQPRDYSTIPTLDIHISLLRDWMISAGVAFVEIPPIPYRHQFFACLTHDVDFAGIRLHRFDRTMLGFVYRALVETWLPVFKGDFAFGRIFKNWVAVLKLPFVLAGIAEDSWAHFDRYTSIEHGCKSTFFLVPFKKTAGTTVLSTDAHKRATKYDVDDIPQQIGRLMATGSEIGLHGLDAWHDLEKGEQERLRITGATGKECPGVRIHWLWCEPDTCSILEKAGFAYDSSAGYNDCIGFKSGTVQVYRPPGCAHLLELPLNIQDTALFFRRRMGLTEKEARSLCTRLVDTICRFGGVLTVNWHDRSLEPDRLWGNSYQWLLKEFRARNAWIGSAQQIVDWFRCRRAISFRDVNLQDDRLTVQLDAGGKPPVLEPGICLRVYPSHRPDPGAKNQPIDIPWDGSPIIKISLDQTGGQKWPASV